MSWTQNAKLYRIVINNMPTNRKCPSGQIRRKAYVRQDGTKVSAVCIMDRGKPGRGKKLWTVRKDGLRKFGYSLKKSDKERQAALRRAVKGTPGKVMNGRRYSSKGLIILRLGAIRNYMKNEPKMKTYYRKLSKDMVYVRNTWFALVFS